MTITDLLQQHGVEHRLGGEHHHVRHGWCGVECWKCSPASGRYKCGINLNSLAVSCWSCGTARLFDVLVHVVGLPVDEAARLAQQLYRDRGRLYPDQQPAPRAKKVVLPEGTGELLPIHRRYLESRGLDPDDMVRLWDLRGIGLAAKLAWRLVLPITYRGEIVSWTSRAPSDAAVQRYIAAQPDQEKIDHHTLLYGGDYVRHSCIVTEGPFDVLRIGPGAVALLGSNMTPPQLLALSKIPIRVICLDNEPAAQRRARRYAHDLSVFPGTTTIVTLDAKDPSAASASEIKELRKMLE